MYNEHVVQLTFSLPYCMTGIVWYYNLYSDLSINNFWISETALARDPGLKNRDKTTDVYGLTDIRKFWNFTFSSQIRGQLKRKAYEDAGLPPPTEQSPKKQMTQPKQVQQTVVVSQPAAKTQEIRGNYLYDMTCLTWLMYWFIDSFIHLYVLQWRCIAA